jgi:hypothetical protein
MQLCPAQMGAAPACYSCDCGPGAHGGTHHRWNVRGEHESRTLIAERPLNTRWKIANRRHAVDPAGFRAQQPACAPTTSPLAQPPDCLGQGRRRCGERPLGGQFQPVRAVPAITYGGGARLVSHLACLDATRRCRGMAASNDGIPPPLPTSRCSRQTRAPAMMRAPLTPICFTAVRRVLP